MSKNQIDINDENGNVWLTFDKKFLDSILARAAKVHDDDDKENGDGSSVGQGYKFKVQMKQQSCDVEDAKFHISYSTENGEIWMHITHDFDEQDHIKLAEVIIKKLNKAKALFETLK